VWGWAAARPLPDPRAAAAQKGLCAFDI
jgi:hypothetical protein